MTLRMVVDLSDRDLEHYRRRLDDSRRKGVGKDEKELVRATRELLEQVRQAGVSQMIQTRLAALGDLASMLEDEEWAPEGEDRENIRAVLAYFTDPMDMIPDDLPGLGYLDDALMTELIVRELRHELDAYRDFCHFREHREKLGEKKEKVSRSDWIAEKRRQLFMRIKRRRSERRRHGSQESPTPRILQYRG